MIHIMDAFNAFKIYMGLKAHFNSDYDFTKYGGKTRASKSSYLKRKDKHFFGKVAVFSKKFKSLAFASIFSFNPFVISLPTESGSKSFFSQ